MENHHFYWENPLFLWPCSSSQTVGLPGRVHHPCSPPPAAVGLLQGTVKSTELQQPRAELRGFDVPEMIGFE